MPTRGLPGQSRNARLVSQTGPIGAWLASQNFCHAAYSPERVGGIKAYHVFEDVQAPPRLLGVDCLECWFVMGSRSAKSVGASPASLYIYVENVDKVVEKATKLGGTVKDR
jgi:hypothetical protein